MPSTLAAYTPTPTVTIGRADSIAERIVAVSVDETLDVPARCEIRLDNWGTGQASPGYIDVDRSTFDFGDDVTVALGPPDEHLAVFSGKVTGIEADYSATAGPTLVVLAEDPLQDLRMVRRTRTFEQSSDADIVRAIASDHDLTPVVDLPGTTHAVVCQLDQSDLAFLRDRVVPLGVDVWVEGRELHVGARVDEPVVLRFGVELLSMRLLADVSMQATEQRVTGWNPAAKEAVEESSDESALGAELGGGIGGGGALDAAFGTRIATATMPGAATPAEARELAAGLYRERARRFVTGSGVADGSPALRAGREVELAGLGAMFEGRYRTTRVTHRFDLTDGYRTEFDVRRAGMPR